LASSLTEIPQRITQLWGPLRSFTPDDFEKLHFVIFLQELFDLLHLWSNLRQPRRDGLSLNPFHALNGRQRIVTGQYRQVFKDHLRAKMLPNPGSFARRNCCPRLMLIECVIAFPLIVGSIGADLFNLAGHIMKQIGRASASLKSFVLVTTLMTSSVA
jgi:hypothetical protein